MQNDSIFLPIVNANPVLFLHRKGSEIVPAVLMPDGAVQPVENSEFGRWLLRVSFTHLDAQDQEAASWYNLSSPLNLYKPKNIVHEPRTYQKLAIKRMSLSNSCLWLPMGSGKTFVVIYYCISLYEQAGAPLPFVVVCPPSVFGAWEDQVSLHIKKECNPQTVIVHGPKKEKILRKLRSTPLTGPTFIITSYETLASIADSLAQLPTRVLVFDESNKIKNIDTKRTQTAFDFVNKNRNAHVYCLSGTPSMTDPMGFYTQYEILGQNRSGFSSFAAFENHFAEKELFMTIELPNGKVTSLKDSEQNTWLQTRRPKDSNSTYAQLGYFFSRTKTSNKVIKILNKHPRYTSFKNIEMLNQITRRNAYAVEKEVILPELPDKTYVRRTVTLPDEQRRSYNELLESNRTVLMNTRIQFSSNTPHIKLLQIAQGYILLDGEPVYFNSQPKINELLEILEENQNEKVVVWSPFPPQIEKISQELTKHDITNVTFYGKTAISARADIVRHFHSINGPRCFIGNPSVGGLGIDLTAASLEVFMSNWYMPEERCQAEDRLHRLNQRNPVTIVDITASNTLESAILRRIFQRIDLQGQILSMSELLGDTA